MPSKKGDALLGVSFFAINAENTVDCTGRKQQRTKQNF